HKINGAAMKIIIFSLIFTLTSPLWAKPLPVEYFANLPDVSNLSLSPDGKKTSSVVRIDADKTQGMAVEVVDLATGEKKYVLYSDNQKYIFHWVRWKDNQTLLVGAFF